MSEEYKYPQLRAENFLGENREIIVTTKTISDIFPLHCHDFFEIEIITEGGGTHVFNGKKYRLRAGNAYIVKPTDFHEVIPEGSITICNITFREKMLNESTLLRLARSERHEIRSFVGEELEALIMASRLLQIESEKGNAYSKSFLEYLVHFFVSEKNDSINSEQLSGIKKALVYLELHFREKPTLSVLAKEAGFNPTYFSEIFKAATGVTYIEKLNELRLGYACSLLASGCSVSYACFESGFGSLSNFFTAFKKKYKISPKEYAKSSRN